MYAMEKAMRTEVIPVRLKLPDDYTAKLNSAATVNI